MTLYRRATGGVARLGDPAVAAALERRGAGDELADHLRRELERELGVALGGVRLHTDSVATRAADALGAEAFTLGEDVFFAAGRFAPETAAGRALIAHELAHVAQARRGEATRGALRVSSPGEAHEREAERVAARVAARSAVLERMGRLFGADFRRVALHADSPATDGAKAIARGTEVHVAPGAFRPGTPEGDHVIAHELAHVLQVGTLGPVSSHDALEVEANRAADRVARGEPATVQLAAAGGAAYAYTDGKGNVLPDPIDVTWNGDPFHLKFRLDDTQSSPRFMCKLMYTGPHPMDGVGIHDPAVNATEFGVMVAPSQLHAQVRRQSTNALEIDLFGDGNQIIRIEDVASFDPRRGRVHDTRMWLNRAQSSSAHFYVHDPKAKASNIAAPPPDERPGMTPMPMGTLGPNGVWTVQLDADGDQFAELELQLHNLTPSGPAMRVRMTLVQLATKASISRELQLPRPEAAASYPADVIGALLPVVTQINDGGRSTILTLTATATALPPQLVIDPPSRTAQATTYHVIAPGLAEDLVFPASTAHPVFETETATIDGNIVSVDLALGAYQDKFRLTIQPRTATTAVLGLAQLFHGALRSAQGAELQIARPVVFEQIAVGPTSLGLDLDGDHRPDLMVYDALTTPVRGAGANPENDRDHHVRILGAAIGGEKTFEFRIRANSPMVDGGTSGADHIAGSNATAIGGLKAQKAEGTTLAAHLNTYEAAMIAERRKAVPSIIRQATLTAWAALSDSLIKLRGARAPDVGLQQQAAAQADAFLKELATDTASATKYQSARGTVFETNEYTRTQRVTGYAPTGPGQQLARDLRQGDIQAAVANYEALVGGLDQWIADRMAVKAEGPDADRLRLIVGQRHALGELDGLGAQPVMAVFQPDAKFKNEQGYVSQIPLSLYYWKAGSTWYLRNLSNPDHVYTVTTDAGPDEAASLQKLLSKLDDPDRLPTGLIHYEIPGKTAGEVNTRDGMTWKKALTYLGLALAATGFTLATFGTGAVEVAGVWVAAGAGLASAGGAALDLYDKHAHGDLTGKTALLDLAQIVSGLAGASALASGRITVAAANAPAGARWAGNWARLAVLSSKLYLPATRAAAAADAVSFAVISDDMARELDKVDADGKLRLLIQWAGMATMSSLSVKNALPSALKTRTLVLSPGPDGPVATLALNADSTILDSQISIALDKAKRGAGLTETQQIEKRVNLSPLEKNLVARAKAMKDPRVTDRGIAELGSDMGNRGTPIGVERTSKEYQDMVQALEGKPPVGRAKGVADREIVADSFFAVTEPGAKPTLATGDAGVYNPLAERAGIKTARLGGKTVPEKLTSPEGCPATRPDGTQVILRGDRFDVTVNGRTLTIIPIK